MSTKPGITEVIKKLPRKTKVLYGTISGVIATALVHPLDVIKVRLQISDRFNYNSREMARLIVRCEGVGALYAGLSAGVLRQATNTTTRLATYHMMNEHVKRRYNLPSSQSLKTEEKVLIGVCAGLAGALAGTPSDVILVRMMADGPEDPCSRRLCKARYTGAFHAIYKISREEGVATLWRGGTLTLARSVLVSIAQIGIYAEVNELVGRRKVLSELNLHVFTSIVSSFVTSIVSLPVDLIKSRYQVRTGDKSQKEIFNDIVRKKGFLYLWKGFTPYFSRMSIHTMLTLIIFQELTELFYVDK